MTKIERNRICFEAIAHYGKELQLEMVQEELAELIQSISKYKRNKSTKSISNIEEEIADVEIMLFQLKEMLPVSTPEIEYIKDMKLNRLQQRIKEDKK